MPNVQAFPLTTKTGRKGKVFRKSRFLDREDLSRVQLDDGTELNVSSAALAVQWDGSFLLDDGVIQGNAPAQVAAAPAPVSEPEAAPQETLDLQETEEEPEVEAGATAAEEVESTPEAVAEPEVEAAAPAAVVSDPEPRPEAVAAAAAEPAATAATETTTYDAEPEEDIPVMPKQAMAEEPASVSNQLYTEDVQVERIPVNQILETRPGVRQEGDVTVIPVVEEVITVQKRLLLKEEVRITRKRVENRDARQVVLNGSEPQTFGADGRPIQTNG